jgi:peptidoglycan/xylan/chitin deacetylase (PgdA/CDA1 family)
MDDDRDFIGYGADPPDPQWPGGARVAVNINVNFEGGGERSILEGDPASEGALNDIGQPALPGLRSPLVESVFEYGSRVGGWRLLRLFRRFGVKVCLLAVARAAERNPELIRAVVEDGHEIVSHGYRWLDYQVIPEEIEREHVRLGIEILERVAGVRPVGWMTGRPSANTRRLHLELGGFLYDRDSLNDELPYWVTVGGPDQPGGRHLVIPYSFETNDNRFDQNRGFSTGEDFARYMIDCFDTLYTEGADHPKLMSLAVHDRLIGRPAGSPGSSGFSITSPAATASGSAPAATSPSIGAASTQAEREGALTRRTLRITHSRSQNEHGRPRTVVEGRIRRF